MESFGPPNFFWRLTPNNDSFSLKFYACCSATIIKTDSLCVSLWSFIGEVFGWMRHFETSSDRHEYLIALKCTHLKLHEHAKQYNTFMSYKVSCGVTFIVLYVQTVFYEVAFQTSSSEYHIMQYDTCTIGKTKLACTR